MRLSTKDLLGGEVLPDVSQVPAVKAARDAWHAAMVGQDDAMERNKNAGYTPESISAYRDAETEAYKAIKRLQNAEEAARALLDSLKGGDDEA